MLVELDVANFAIIDRLTLRLAPGFNVLTGETGAGKSILIDAVGAMLGSKIGAEYVRTGAESARVEGIFEVSTDAARERLQSVLGEHGIDDQGELILSREIYRSGRTTARVNGRAVTQAVLRDLGERLVEIHGQTEHLSLLRVAEQIDILDRFAGLLSQRAALASLVAELRQVRRAQQELVRDERELARRVDLLKFQIDEIDAARLRPDEEDELAGERRILGNAERLTQLSGQAYALLTEGGRTSAVLDQVGQIVSLVADLSHLDPALQEAHEMAANASYVLEDIARTLRNYRDSVEYNPERLAEIEERIDRIHNLKRKYGASIADVLAFSAQAREELDGIVHSGERLAELAEREGQILAALAERAAMLSQERRRAAVELAGLIERELADLNMAKTRFEVFFAWQDDPDGVPITEGDGPPRRLAIDATGVDRTEFLIAPNPGEPPKPLARIASGGETSRLLLAMKAILGRSDAVPTLIFDEIDVGIGGRTGLVVGQKLAGLAGGHQVICVTHLPQTASYGDAHFQIRKSVADGRTATAINRLNDADRVEELAQMLGAVTASTRQSAAEMIEQARAAKAARGKETECPAPAENSANQPATLVEQTLVAEKATIADVPQIHQIIKVFADRGDMLHRSKSELYENLRDFHVVRDGDRVAGCAGLHLLWSDLAEVRSVAVHPDYQRRGLARVLVEAAAAEARTVGLTTIFCLTYRPEVFARLGFVRTGISQLPRKVWGECYRCPKFPVCNEVPMIRVLYDNVQPSTGGFITLPVITPNVDRIGQ